mmetsp:Transcript_12865/g.24448  ORF Transcript_12865/g.24448 Transcript_12865/m.24448 type:complete len:571 (-) Transcript_12865:303-2015(-)|eukprot:CAMPEP_0114246418 /NCGR_PEP_ID=MMETSP0058-20121206/12450_1 /TAXON_ID=36894 /ORGANISM="Pyramimonas parkeae, CCMP726" /LENGTH=570 /DNA_ID=CAMNT_0001359599 /DNA_START=162 /DNA_END=1874 /DNA_ORIENTATION=+
MEPSSSEPLLGAPNVPKRSTLLTITPFILGNEFCERLAYYGLATNLVVYFQRFGGQSAAGAVSEVGLWSGSCYLTPLLGAWVADSYLGRYKTILLFTCIYLIGMLALSLHPWLFAPAENQAPSTAATTLLYSALYLVALGTGGIKPNVSAFGAEQFDESNAQDAQEKASFFNWFYFAINVGSLIASLVVVYIQENVSWVIGFSIPTAALLLAVVLFWAGRNKYRVTQPKSSPLARFASVCFTALTTPKPAQAPGEPPLQLTDWLDRASLRGRFSRTQIHEVRLVLKVMPVFLTSVMYWTVYQQMSSVFVQQGVQMDRNVGGWINIPSASLSTFDTVSIVVLVPVFEKGLYPLLATYGIKLTQLQKMGWGLLVAALAMLTAAGVEMRRRDVAVAGFLVDGSSPPAAQFSIFWQMPQYVLIGTSEVLASIAQLEFFYEQAPKVMRSCAMALQLLSSALGMYLSSALVYAVQQFTASDPWLPNDLNDGHLDLYFMLLAGLTLFNLMAHVLVSWHYEGGQEMVTTSAPTSYIPATAARSASMPISLSPGGAQGDDMSRSISAMPSTPVLPANFR